MDLEKLDKSQIVLLTMLVSFVTSIATGIVTASLVEKAPTDVTRVIQRVVEKTAQSVVPTETQRATVITREKTIIIKESDLVTSAISKNKSKIISVVDANSGDFVSLGVFVDSKGTLAVDASKLVKDGKYSVTLNKDKKDIPLTVIYKGGARGVALLSAKTKRTGLETITTSDTPLKLGQTIVAFIGDGSIAQGIVTKLSEGGYIETNINGTKIAPGSVLININGDVVGMSTGESRKNDKSSFIPIRVAFAQLKAKTQTGGKIDNKNIKEKGAVSTSTTKSTNETPKQK